MITDEHGLEGLMHKRYIICHYVICNNYLIKESLTFLVAQYSTLFLRSVTGSGVMVHVSTSLPGAMESLITLGVSTVCK